MKTVPRDEGLGSGSANGLIARCIEPGDERRERSFVARDDERVLAQVAVQHDALSVRISEYSNVVVRDNGINE